MRWRTANNRRRGPPHSFIMGITDDDGSLMFERRFVARKERRLYAQMLRWTQHLKLSGKLGARNKT